MELSGLLDCLVLAGSDLEYHGANFDVVERTGFNGVLMGGEGDLSSRLDSWIAGTLLKHFLRDHHAADNWCIDKNGPQLVLSIILWKVYGSHSLEPI